MADNLTKDIRRKNMSHIRSKNSKPEEMVRKYLFAHGFRYRKNVGSMPGHPDIVLPKYHTIVFVNGCFWHKHNCDRFVWPASNVEYWKPKIEGNAARDRKNAALLCEQGWNVLVVWECELKRDVREKRLQKLVEQVEGGVACGTD